MFQRVYWNVSITHFAPLLSVTASRKFKTHQVELSCLIYVLSTFCKWISGKMPPSFVILQGALRNTLIFCVWNLISWLLETSVEFRCTVFWLDQMCIFIYFLNRAGRGEMICKAVWNGKCDLLSHRAIDTWTTQMYSEGDFCWIRIGWQCFPPPRTQQRCSVNGN